MELEFEHAMGNDWRLFRAKLVAQEQLEKESQDSASVSASGVTNNSPSYKQSHPGAMLKGALSQFFSAGSQLQKNNEEGDCSTEVIMEQQGGDPFASMEEIMAVRRIPRVNVNEKQWAHPLSHIEPGCVLVANEKLGGIYHQTVVLIIDHNDALGSTGLVINRPFPCTLLKVADETVSNIDLSLKLTFADSPVAFGGPVGQDNFSVLHGYGLVDGSQKVAPGVFVGGSHALMKEVRRGRFDPQDMVFLKGHASWSPSQLSHELDKKVWYVAAVSEDFILKYASSDNGGSGDLWKDILMCLGGEYADVAKRCASERGDARLSP